MGEYPGAQGWSQGIGRGGLTLSSPGWAGEYGEYKRGEDRHQMPYSGKMEPAVGGGRRRHGEELE